MSKEEIMALLGKLIFALSGTKLLTEVTDALGELLEYKQIDNANPSEALKCLKKNNELFDEIALENPTTYKDNTVIEAYLFKINAVEIERALLKAQELETMANEYDLQPSQIREALLAFGMMQGAGYKVSDIEKAQKQESKLKFLEDAMDLPTNCFSTFENRNGDEITIMRRERYEEYCTKEEALKELFENHIEFVAEEDRCYFKIKNSKGKEKSFTSYTMLDFWKEVLK